MRLLLICIVISLFYSCNQVKNENDKNKLTQDKIEEIRTMATQNNKNAIEYKTSQKDLENEILKIWDAKSISFINSQSNVNGKQTSAMIVKLNECVEINDDQEKLDKINQILELIKNNVTNISSYDKIGFSYVITKDNGETINFSMDYPIN